METRRSVRRRALTITLAALWSLGLAAAAAAGTVYVDAANTGGPWDGSKEHPFATIHPAVAAAAAGDTVRVAAGTYDGGIVIDGKPLKLLGEDPAATTIGGGLSVVTAAGEYTAGQNVVEVAGFTIWGGGYAGVYVNSATVSGKVHNCILSANAYGVLVEAGGYAQVYNNVIEGSSGAGAEAANYSTLSLTNNVILRNAYGAYSYVGSTVSSSYNAYFENATDWATSRDWWGDPNSTFTTANDSFGVDPRFVALDTSDYHLAPDSPCVNAGSPSAPTNDPDGTRNDQGAYGGPGAAGFWPRPLGTPVVTGLAVTPHDVPQGATLTVTATGKIR